RRGGVGHVGQHRQDPPAPRLPQARRLQQGRGARAQPRSRPGAAVAVRERAHRTRLPRVPSVFCPTPAAEAVLRHVPALVVLRAPRGYGKTSTVAYWLRSGELDDRSVAWLTVADGM